MDQLSDESFQRLEASSEKVKRKVDSFMRKDREFINAISQGTGDIAKVHLRFKRFRQMIKEAVG